MSFLQSAEGLVAGAAKDVSAISSSATPVRTYTGGVAISSSNNMLLYGGIAVAVVIMLMMMGGKGGEEGGERIEYVEEAPAK